MRIWQHVQLQIAPSISHYYNLLLQDPLNMTTKMDNASLVHEVNTIWQKNNLGDTSISFFLPQVFLYCLQYDTSGLCPSRHED